MTVRQWLKLVFCTALFIAFLHSTATEAAPPKITLVLTPINFLRESTITPADELALRNRLRDALLESDRWELALIDDSLSMFGPQMDRASLHALGTKHRADFVLSGQMDVIDDTFWAISFVLISTHSAEFDSTFNADPSVFNLTGRLPDILQSDFIDQMRDMLQAHILAARPVTPWWKKGKVLIPASMISAATLGYIVTEWIRNGRSDSNGEGPDLPVSPDPPR